MAEPLSIGRVRGHRGGAGEITVVIASGRPERWQGVVQVWVDCGAEGDVRRFEVQESRSYKDRLILKLKGVDDPEKAAGLKGCTVRADPEAAPALPEGEYYLERLIGLTVREEGRALGKVTDVYEAGGTHVLVVDQPAGGELLIPLVREMVKEVAQQEASIHVVLPRGLKELGQDGSR